MTISKALAVLTLLTFVAVGAFGFALMLHSGDMLSEECTTGLVNPECPISVFAHVDAWKDVSFTAAQIFIILALAHAIFRMRDTLFGDRVVLKHKVRDWISKRISEVQFLYSILFSRGILNPKLFSLIA